MPRGVFKHKPFSDEHKRNLSESHKGLTSNVKGMKFSKEKYPDFGMRGKTAWNKGLTKEVDERVAKNARNISKVLLEVWSQISKEERVQAMDKCQKAGTKAASILSKGKMPKCTQRPGMWRNIKRGYYDINKKKMFFRSKWEANYALYLDFLIKHKQIKKWTYEEDVFIFDKIKSGTKSYRPDFKVYNNDKNFEYHEVKGWITPSSKTQFRRMTKYYPEIKLIIIDKDAYGDIKKKLGKMLKFY